MRAGVAGLSKTKPQEGNGGRAQAHQPVDAVARSQGLKMRARAPRGKGAGLRSVLGLVIAAALAGKPVLDSTSCPLPPCTDRLTTAFV